MKIYLVTGVTENYYQKAIPFIESMKLLTNVEKIVITLGFHISESEREKYPDTYFIFQDIEYLKPELTKINCLQHGAFMDVLHFVSDEDIIIFSDGDIIIQRDISDTEIELLKSFTNDDIGCNMNNYKARSLKSDFELLEPLINYEKLLNNFPILRLGDSNGYNTGNLVARPQAWKLLRDLYVEDFDFINRSAVHYAKQQLLINIITNIYFNCIEMPQSWHTHGHFGLPPFATIENGVVKVDNGTVLFRHFL